MEDMKTLAKKEVLQDLIGVMHTMMMTPEEKPEGPELPEEMPEGMPEEMPEGMGEQEIPEGESPIRGDVEKYMSGKREKSGPGAIDVIIGFGKKGAPTGKRKVKKGY